MTYQFITLENGKQRARSLSLDSSAPTITAVAAANLSGHRAIVLNSTQQAIYADNQTSAHAARVLGITTGAAAIGSNATIQTFGLTESSWNWSIGPIFLATDGTLTQTPPTTGFLLVIASAIAPTKIFINIQSPILR